MNDSNTNTAATETGVKIISSLYTKHPVSGDFVPPQVILLKFKHSNNTHRMELGGVDQLKTTDRRDVSYFGESEKIYLEA